MSIPEVASLADAAAVYPRTGVVIWRQLLPVDLVERCAHACRAAWPVALADPEGWRTRFRDGPAGPVVDRMDPARAFAPGVAESVDHPDVLALAAVGCGGPAVTYKDKYIAKGPGSGGYRLHQDFAYTQYLGVGPDALAQVFIPLSSFGARNGATEVAPGCHARLLTAPGQECDPPADALDEGVFETLELEPGDVVLVHLLLPHRSPVNWSEAARPLLAGSYSLDRGEDVWARYYTRYRRRALEDRARWS